MTTVQLKNDLLRMIAETDDPIKLKLMVDWFGIVREEHDWWLEISEKERQMILEGKKQLAEGQGIPHEQVRSRVRELFKKFSATQKQ